MIRVTQITTGAVLFGLDTLSVLVAWPLVLWLARPTLDLASPQVIEISGFVYPAANLMLLFSMGLYRRDAIQQLGRSLARVPLVIGMGAVLAIVALVVCPAIKPIHGRQQTIISALAVVTFSINALVTRLAIDLLVRRHVLRRRLLIVGTGERAWELLLMLGREGGSLHDHVTLLHLPSQPPVDPRLLDERLESIARAPDGDIAAVAQQVNADLIIVAPDDRRGMNLEKLLECKKLGFPVVPYLTFVEREIRRVDLKRLELSWLVYSDGFTFGIIHRVLKRAFDLAVSFIVLLVTAPLLLGGMIAIRLEGPGAVFYSQQRVTRDGKIFKILKLRTMRVNAEAAGAVWAAEKDNRITKVGNFLRRARIDELPQLLNILRGQMSFVGPRPERPMFVKELAEQIPLYHERHMVKAGLTGWAQINYPYGASVNDARSKLSYDLYYVKNFSILFDFVILLQTLRVVLWPTGVR
jgi:sugar transferase (PEP-CTERM system associated)